MSNLKFYNKPRNVGLSNSSGNSGGSRFNRRDNLDEINLDFQKDAKSIIGEILENISKKEGLSKGKRLAYLNAFVKYLQNKKSQTIERASERNLGYSVEDIFLCLRVCLINEAAVIRMAALRVLRYVLVTEEDLITMNACQIHYLIVRSMDIVLNNSGERTQATRLCQRILAIPNGASHFPCAITRALVAIGFDGQTEHDKLYRGSLSLLCQLALLNPMQFIECGGVRVLLHNILSCTSPMVLEAMIGSLLHLLNVPETRDAAGINLQSLVAPFTDVHFKQSGHEPSEKDLDEREVGYQCAKTAIGTVLKSWSGIAHFCQSKNSGLQALVDALYIEQLEIRRTILDLICEIVGIKFPTWSDEVSVALTAVDPSNPQDSWKLQEGFVVQEALSVLPHLAVSTPNITANHMALIVFAFIQRGLLEALVEVIVTGDTFICVRGTVLLGELLSLIDRYIPLECYDPSQCISTLIRYSSGVPSNQKSSDMSTPTTKANESSSSKVSDSLESRQQRAMEAVSVLSSLQKIKSRPPTQDSVFLQAQLEYAGYISKRPPKFQDRLGQVQLNRQLKRDMEGNPTKLLKDTGVLNSKDSTTWQWETILTLIKWAPTSLKRVDDSSWRSFLKRLVDYFKPSNNLYARVELGKGQSRLLAKVGCAFIQFLADDVENFSGTTLLEELLVDIGTQLDELIRQSSNPFGCFLSPNKLESTLSQTYFLFVGKLSHSTKGYKILERGDILKRFYDLILEVQHESYIKLIISSLSYREEYCKRILNAALTCSFDGSRLYATQFLRVLVRAKLSNFSKWGIELLVNQLEDKNKSISLAALDILEEAIHDKMFLESLIALSPTLTHLCDRGLLLLICFVSLPSGFKFLLKANFLHNELKNWKTTFNKRYVELVEVLVRDSVSTLRRGDDGKYPERTSRNTEQCRFVDIYAPPHLYGQLAQHKDGLEMLLEFGDIDGLIRTVNGKKCTSTEDIRELKAALWALSHFGTSVDAVQMLEDTHVIESMAELGIFCPTLSLRHTIFHCLCLLCVTQQGGDILRKYEWHIMPRSHHDSFTIWAPEFFMETKIQELREKREEELQQEDGDEYEDPEKVSLADTCSNILIEEDAEFFLMDEDINPTPLEMKESPNFGMEDDEESSLAMSMSSEKQTVLVVEAVEISSGIGARKLSHKHHRSQSDSQTLILTKNKDSSRATTKDGGGNKIEKKTDDASAGEDMVDNSSITIIPSGGGEEIIRANSSGSSGVSGSLLRGMRLFKSGSGSGSGSYPGRSGGSWRWRKSKSDSVSDCTTSGVSSCDSLVAVARGSHQPSSEHVQTLSPIPSSASIATTICSTSQQQLLELESPDDSSRMTMTEPVSTFGTSGSAKFLSSSYGSPAHSVAYRSIKLRKPVIRMPILSDSDIYPSQFGGRRSTGLRENKTNSLDRHFILSPGDLFGESKLMRVNSSMTSFSTPSFRIRPESDTKGPCYMGLCLPKDFQALFLTDSSIPLHVRMASFQEETSGSDGEGKGHDDSFEYHSISNCMGCYRLKSEEDESMMEDKSIAEVPEADDDLGVDQLLLPSDGAAAPSTMVSIGSIVSGAGASLDNRRKIEPGSLEGRAVIRKETLRLVSNLISCVGAKANEQGLLRLKQKFPRAFQDLCLYSEICALISKYNIRLPLRRFLQEFFFDMPFEEFYMVANQIIGGEESQSQSEASHGVLPIIPPLEDEARTAFNEEEEEEELSGDDLTTTESDILDLKIVLN